MEGNTYGYVRVSTQEQNEARQLTAMREFGVLEEHIVVERLSEKVSGLWSRLDDIRDKLRAACEEVKGRYSDAFASQGDFMD